LSFLGKGFGKSKSRLFSKRLVVEPVETLVSVKDFFISAVVLFQSKVRLFPASVLVCIKFLGIGQKQNPL